MASKNMLPTINVEDGCIVNKFEYSSNTIQRFDIVVFNAPESAKKGSNEITVFISRVIGLPNEKVEIRNGKIYINDKLLEETFEKIQDEGNFPPIIVPENEYYLLGDNRLNSYDSRYWKPKTIEREKVLGKVIQIVPKP